MTRPASPFEHGARRRLVGRPPEHVAAPRAAADVAVQLDVTPEVGHLFQASAPELREAEAALSRTLGRSCEPTSSSPNRGTTALLDHQIC
jgi:hypothetical protein